MSTHRLETTMPNGTPVTVVAGWEPDVRSFYLLIEAGLRKVFEYRPGAAASGRRWEISKLIEVLDQFGIRLPRSMLDEIVLDAQGETASKHVHWTVDGRPTRRA